MNSLLLTIALLAPALRPLQAAPDSQQVGAQQPLLLTWQQNPANGHWYASTPAMRWTAAERAARRIGGNLATVRNEDENHWLYQTFCQDSVAGCWIGLNDAATNGTFVWTAGGFVPYQNWDDANLLNTAPDETYVHIQGARHPNQAFRGRWNDIDDLGGWLGLMPGVIEMAKNPDADADGVLDQDEIALGTNPLQADSDGDGLEDGWEIGFRPNFLGARLTSAGQRAPMATPEALMRMHDPYWVTLGHLDPTAADSDGDGLGDGFELGFGRPDGDPSRLRFSHPLDADSDDDGLTDGKEDRNHNGFLDEGETDPSRRDSDGDGLADGLELGLVEAHADTDPAFFQADLDPATTTDPLRADSDAGGRSDGEEDHNHDGMVQLGEGDPAIAADDRVVLRGRLEGGHLRLECVDLRPGCELVLLYAVVRPQQTPEEEAASGNPTTTGLGLSLDVHGTAVKILRRGVAGTRTQVLVRLPSTLPKEQRLRLQAVELYPWGGPRKSNVLELHLP